MEKFITTHHNEIIVSAIVFIIILLLKFFFTVAVRKVSKIGDFNPVRTNLIIKYINILLGLMTIAALTFIWSVDFEDIGVLLSSIFAVIGVALFAQWSILSNITAGVIIFFSYPFKIGNSIKILDKDLIESEEKNTEVFIIEDIKAFHLHLRRENGEILTYPNTMVLQKGVVLISTYKESELSNEQK